MNCMMCNFDILIGIIYKLKIIKSMLIGIIDIADYCKLYNFKKDSYMIGINYC